METWLDGRLSPQQFTDSFQGSLTSVTQTLLTIQAIVTWIMTHPLLSIGLLVLTLSLLQLVAESGQQLLRFLLKAILNSPRQLLLWSIQRVRASSISEASSKEKINAIVERLESLRMEQENLLKELKTLLDGESLSKSPSKSDL